MIDFDRTEARRVLHLISSYNVYTQFRVEDGTLYVKVPTGEQLTEEQTRLIREHKSELIELLTTPPDTVNYWRCSKWGDWLNFRESEPVGKTAQTPRKHKPVNIEELWIRKATEAHITHIA